MDHRNYWNQLKMR